MVAWLVLHTLVALALAALALGLGRLLRLGPAARHALWLVVLLKLLTPPLVRWPWLLPAVLADDPPAAAMPSPPAPLAVPVAVPPADPPLPAEVVLVEEWAPPAPEPAPVVAADVAEVPAPTVAPPVASPPASGWRWREVFTIAALAVWIGGAAVVALVQLARMRRVRRVLAEARPASPWLEKRVGELSAALGIRPPHVRVLDGLASPLVWGLGRARLLWPRGLEDGLTPEGVGAVLVHELAHLRRRDHWVGWLLLAGGCVWWWHPLFRLVQRRLGCEAELACDAWVVATLPEARRAYAEALIEVCQRGSWAAAAAPAWGAAGSRRDFERRLVMVMRERVPCRLSARMLLGVGLLAVLALPAWTLGQAVAPPPATPAAKGPAVAPLLGPGEALPLAGAPDVALKALADDPTGKAVPKPSDRDRRLQELEKKVEALLRELKEMRGAGKKPVGPVTSYVPVNKGGVTYYKATVEYGKPVAAPETITLTRATYALPAAKAEALAKFLKEHVKSSVLEVSVEKDRLTVTTTPQDQQTIRQFVGLLQGKRPRGIWYQPQYDLTSPAGK